VDSLILEGHVPSLLLTEMRLRDQELGFHGITSPPLFHPLTEGRITEETKWRSRKGGREGGMGSNLV
jgi:hypothetical protein